MTESTHISANKYSAIETELVMTHSEIKKTHIRSQFPTLIYIFAFIFQN